VTLAGTTRGDLIDLRGIELVGVAQITGGAGNDVIIGSAQDDVILGGAGIDQLSGMDGRDTYRGTAAELRGDQLFFEFNDAIEITNFLTPSTTTFRVADFGSTLFVDPDGPGGVAELKLLLGNGFDAAGFVATAAEGGGTRIEYFG
jgi:Ca2+-binding RTX toxin-like protein